MTILIKVSAFGYAYTQPTVADALHGVCYATAVDLELVMASLRSDPSQHQIWVPWEPLLTGSPKADLCPSGAR